MSKTIFFMGGCCSGKTTAVNLLKDRLKAQGHNVSLIKESMRDLTELPIEELRQKPSEYLKIEEQIIEKRIEKEIQAYNDTSNTIYLSDRSIFDSIFYLCNYVPTPFLNDAELTKFYEIYRRIQVYAIWSLKKVSGLILACPIYPKQSDWSSINKFRPRQIDWASYYEHQKIREIITTMLNLYAPQFKRIDLEIATEKEKLYEYIDEILASTNRQD